MTGLTGLRCDGCGATFFPVADRCPRCASPEIELVELATTGAVESRTGGDGWAIGEIRLDDGVLVLAALDGDPVVGDRVRHAPADVVRFERA